MNKGILLIIVLMLSILIGSVAGHVDYNYEINKCNNLDSSDSNFDFNYEVEIDAHYNSHCFYYNNHILAYPLNLVLSIAFTLAGIAGLTMLGFLIKMMYDDLNY